MIKQIEGKKCKQLVNLGKGYTGNPCTILIAYCLKYQKFFQKNKK